MTAPSSGRNHKARPRRVQRRGCLYGGARGNREAAPFRPGRLRRGRSPSDTGRLRRGRTLPSGEAPEGPQPLRHGEDPEGPQPRRQGRIRRGRSPADGGGSGGAAAPPTGEVSEGAKPPLTGERRRRGAKPLFDCNRIRRLCRRGGSFSALRKTFLTNSPIRPSPGKARRWLRSANASVSYRYSGLRPSLSRERSDQAKTEEKPPPAGGVPRPNSKKWPAGHFFERARQRAGTSRITFQLAAGVTMVSRPPST